MKMIQIVSGLIACGVVGGCSQEAQQKYGQAGEAASQAARKTTDALATDAKQTGRKIEEGADMAGKATEDATRRTGAAIGRAADTVEEKAQAGSAGGRQALTSASTTGKVKAALLDAPGIDASKINVDTIGRKVVLKGTVQTAKAKILATQIAKKQAGTSYQVQNHLTIVK